MEGLNLDIILGLTGGGGLFAILWKSLPFLLEWLRDRKASRTSLTDTAFKASGMSIESLVTVVNMLEERIAKMRDEYDDDITSLKTRSDEDIAALKKRYEEELTLISVRQKERVTELLDEILILKTQLAKYVTSVPVAQSGGEDIDEAIIEAAEAMKDSVNPREEP